MKICLETIIKILILGMLGAALIMNFLAIRQMRSVMQMVGGMAVAEKPPVAAEPEQHHEQASGVFDEHEHHAPAEVVSDAPLSVIEELPEYDEETRTVASTGASSSAAPVPMAAPKHRNTPSNNRNKKRKKHPTPVSTSSVGEVAVIDFGGGIQSDVQVVTQDLIVPATQENAVAVIEDLVVEQNGPASASNEQSNADAH